MSMAARVVLAAVLVVALHFSARWAATWGMPTEVCIPTGDFQAMPIQLGSWSGEEAPVSEDYRNLGGSHAALHRTYRNPAGAAVYLYSAVFAQVEIPVAPHMPESCYTASGHRIAATRDLTVPAGREGEFLARLLTVDKGGRSICCLYWYQVPGLTYLDGYAQRKLFWSYRGQPTWPAVVKVMLEIPAPNPDKAADDLKDLAGHVYLWVRHYQGTGQE